MVLETWVAPLIVLGFNLDLDNALDLSTLSAFAATEPIQASRKSTFRVVFLLASYPSKIQILKEPAGDPDISGVDLVGNMVMRSYIYIYISSCFFAISTLTPCFGNTFAFV